MEDKKAAAATGTLNYAGFWIRFLAYLIDAIILGTIARILFGSGAANIDTSGGIMAGFQFNSWRTLITLVYTLGFWIALSATPGKMICKLKIVEENGQKLTWQKALLRMVGYVVSAVALFIGFIWIGFDKKKQGWHDKIAHTYVVKK